MSNNASFYFQSNRRGRGRSGENEEARLVRPENTGTSALMGRLGALDQQMGALLRGEGRIASGLSERLTELQGELAGLSVALKELAHLRAGQEAVQQAIEELRAQVARLRVGQEALQVTSGRIAAQVERVGRLPLPLLAPDDARAGEQTESITIQPIRPRLLLDEVPVTEAEAVLNLDDQE